MGKHLQITGNSTSGNGNIIILDSNGFATDSGYSVNDLVNGTNSSVGLGITNVNLSTNNNDIIFEVDGSNSSSSIINNLSINVDIPNISSTIYIMGILLMFLHKNPTQHLLYLILVVLKCI